MRKLPALFFIAVCFLIQPGYAQGQSGGTGNRNLIDNAMADMDRVFTNMDEEVTLVDAYYLGRTIAANILAVYKPYTRNAALTQYVNRICQTLAINSSQPVAYNGYHVIILDSAEFNAFATTGGHIFITKGLAEAAASEDMLAAAIAHELAHITLKHGINLIKEMKITEEASAMAQRAADFSGGSSDAAKRLVLFRNSVAKTMDTMMKNGYSQSQEFEADREAMSILFSSGYDPAALIDLLKVLQRVQSSQKGGFNTTHPSPRERIANVERLNLNFRVTDTRRYRVPRFKSMQF